MSIDFAAVRDGRLTYAQAVSDLTPASLETAMAAIFDAIAGILDGLADHEVAFLPIDPAAPGTDASLAWTLGHVVVHLTAGLEENAALGATLARGVPLEGRSRYEVPWESMRTARQIDERLAESRRICEGFLQAWPNEPHLDLTVTLIPSLGPMNPCGLTALGIFHADSHREQLREIRRQAAAA